MRFIQAFRTCLLVTLLSVACVAVGQGDALSDLITGGDASSEPGSNENAGSAEIELQTTPAQDRDIRQRIGSIFSELEDLGDVQISVSNSVVTLSGQTPDAEAISQADTLASQVEGVVEVVNELTVINDVGYRIDSTVNRLADTTQSFLVSLPMLVLAVASIALFWFLGKLLSKKTSLFMRVAPNLFIAELLGNICWVLITFLGVFIGLSLLDATSLIGTVLGAAGIIGLAVGFAVRDTVENYISSILLSLRNPFLARDYVAIGDIEGSVARLTSRATILISAEGNHIRIPNATVFKSTITNYTRNPQRRFEFVVGIDSEVELSYAQCLALDTLKTVPGVLDDPAGSVLIDKLGDSNVTLTIRAWINQRTHDLLKVRSEAIRLVKQSFDDAGIVMPEPIYRVVMSDGKSVTSSIATPTESDSNSTVVGSNRQSVNTETQDTAADSSVDETLDAEIRKSGEDNLLTGSAPHE